MPEQLAHRQLVPLGAFLDQAPLEGTAEVEHRPAVEGLPAEEDRLLHEAPGDHVDRPPDVALDHVATAVRGRDRAAEVPRSMPTWRTSVFLVIYWLPGAWPSVATRLRASAYAWMPWKSARAMRWR